MNVLFSHYLKTCELPAYREEVRKLRSRVARYTIVDRVLCRKGYAALLIRCITKEEAEYVMRETHKGLCGNHSGGKSLAAKIVLVEYYWPNVI